MTVLLGALALLATTTACRRSLPRPDLGDRYSAAAMHRGPERNPVIVIPGMLGSRLVDGEGTLIWGAFSGRGANPARAENARRIALPMAEGAPLADLVDAVRPDGALETLRFSLFGLPFQLEAYAQVLATLGVGGYRDQQLAEAGAVDYGDDHYTCFQFDYDWRRDNVENARRLHRFMVAHRADVQRSYAREFGGDANDYEVKFDVVAHSMGGLMLRYLLRFGDADLPAEADTPPPVTWAGAALVDKAVLVGTPSAGSVKAFTDLVQGTKFWPFHGAYTPAILGTMPSVYQLLPRDRHRRVRIPGEPWSDILMADGNGDADTPGAIASMPEGTRRSRRLDDPDTWERYGWGLADRGRDGDLAVLLPDVPDAGARRQIALDHQRKCLDRARRFHAALDQPAVPPAGLTLTLFAGDGRDTPGRVHLDAGGRIERVEMQTGDGTVTRDSAVMDERLAGEWTPELRSPIAWRDVNFLFAEHLGLTSDPLFSDNLLFLLLETP